METRAWAYSAYYGNDERRNSRFSERIISESKLSQARAFSLLLWSAEIRDEQLFLMKSCDKICRSLYTESENAIAANSWQEIIAGRLGVARRGCGYRLVV